MSVPPLRLRQPVDVVEAALQVAALLPAWPLVAEARPELRLIVEGHHQVAPQLLEEGRRRDRLQQRDAVMLPVERDIAAAPAEPVRRRLVEPVHATLEHRAQVA